MGISLSRVLRAVQNIYRLPGPVTAPSEVDVTAPIALVHDVSRESEIGSGIGPLGGYYTMQESQTHAVGGRLAAGFSPYDEATFLTELPRDQIDVWLIAAGALATASTGSDELLLQQIGLITGPALNFAPFWPIGYWNELTTVEPVATQFAFENSGGPPWQQPMPYYVIPERRTNSNELRVVSNTTAAKTIQTTMLFWAGPEGTRPPQAY